MKKTYRLYITGRVQGVWYRAWTCETATRLGLNGWVRNRMDGSVEALAYGEEDALKKLAELCHIGPDAARVDDVFIKETDDNVNAGFIQKPTV